MAYAENTSVGVEKSISEIIGLIKRAGANRIAQVEEPDAISMQFFLEDRLLRFRIQPPSLEAAPTRDGRGSSRTLLQRQQWVEQQRKQRARALLLVIKAKLESVESGVETFEEAFLANVVMPDGRTVGEMARPQIIHAYETGHAPTLLLTSNA